MADIVTNTLQIGNDNLILRDADAQEKISDLKEDLSENVGDLKSAINAFEVENCEDFRWTAGQYVNWENGAWSALSNRSRTNLIGIGEHKRIILRINGASDSMGLAFYASNGTTYVSGVQFLNGEHTYNIEVPSNAAYLAFSALSTDVETNSIVFVWADKQNMFNEFVADNLIVVPNITWNANSYCNASSGSLSYITGCSGSDPIPVGDNIAIRIYAFGYGDNRGFCFYDENRSYITGVQYSKGYNLYDVAIPSNAKYIGLSADTQDIGTDFFFFGFTNRITAIQKRLDNELTYVPTLTWTANYYRNVASGDMSRLNGCSASNVIPVNGCKYAHIKTTGYNDGRGFCYYDKNMKFISGWNYKSGLTEYEFEFPSNTAFVSMTANTTEIGSVFEFWFTKTIKSAMINFPAEEMAIKNNFENISSMSMFTSIGCCGDSYTRGQIYNSQGVSLGYWPKNTWAACMGRMYGITANVYAKGGATTESYLTDDGCLPLLLASDPEQLYILALGINDRSYVTIGTIADITNDWHNNPNTYYGNYGKIIEQIMAHAPNAKFLIVKSLLPYIDDSGELSAYYRYNSTACEEIANHYGFPYIETANNGFFKSYAYINKKYGGHPTAPLYAGLGRALGELISKTIIDNCEYFNDFMIP